MAAHKTVKDLYRARDGPRARDSSMTENAEKSAKAGGSASASKKINLEKSLDQLEGIVNALEAGDLSLEQSLKKFEQGVALSKDCQLALDDAQHSSFIAKATFACKSLYGKKEWDCGGGQIT